MDDPPDGVADTGGGLDNPGMILKSTAIEDGGGSVENTPCMVGEPGKVTSLVGFFDRNKADHAASLTIDTSSDDNMLDNVEAQVLNNSPKRLVNEKTPADSRDILEPELETHMNPTTSPVTSLLEPEPEPLTESIPPTPYDVNYRKSLISSSLPAKIRFTPCKTRTLPLTFKARRLASLDPMANTDPTHTIFTIEFPKPNSTTRLDELSPDNPMLEAAPDSQDGETTVISITEKEPDSVTTDVEKF